MIESVHYQHYYWHLISWGDIADATIILITARPGITFIAGFNGLNHSGSNTGYEYKWFDSSWDRHCRFGRCYRTSWIHGKAIYLDLSASAGILAFGISVPGLPPCRLFVAAITHAGTGFKLERSY